MLCALYRCKRLIFLCFLFVVKIQMSSDVLIIRNCDQCDNILDGYEPFTQCDFCELYVCIQCMPYCFRESTETVHRCMACMLECDQIKECGRCNEVVCVYCALECYVCKETRCGDCMIDCFKCEKLVCAVCRIIEYDKNDDRYYLCETCLDPDY